ncbi:MAG: FG-GAP repeat domain-containing protein [Candidatus Njordarchaeia archaeon]
MSNVGVWFLGDFYRLIASELETDYSIIGIVDYNGDGVSEILLKTRHSVRCYSTSNGSLLWKFDVLEGTVSQVVRRDIDLDERDELLILVDTGSTTNLYILDSEGEVITKLLLANEKIYLNRVRGVKLRFDKVLLLVPFEKRLSVYDLKGNMIWNFNAPVSNFFVYRLNDYNNDGRPELLIAYYLHEELMLELVDLEATTTVWSTSIYSETAERPLIEERELDSSIALFLFYPSQLYIVDGKNGEVLYERYINEVELFSGTADVDGDGSKEIILCGMSETSNNSILEIFYPEERKSIKYVFNASVIDCRLGDYNGDKKEEVCIIARNSILFFDSSGLMWRINNLFQTSIYHTIGEDFDRDGVVELFVMGDVGAAIVDFGDKEILWLDDNLILNGMGDMVGMGDIIPVDLDGDGVDEWLIVDDENLRLVALKGEVGEIKELWSLQLDGVELLDLQVIYPSPIIVLAVDDKVLGINGNGEVMWICDECSNFYITFGEVNGDGKPEVIIYNEKIGLKAMDIETGKTIWSLDEKFDLISIGDVNGDGKQEIVLIRGKALNILNGEDGKAALIKIIEFPITRVDVVDLDSDGMDEIMIFGENTIFVLKNYTQLWEIRFIDPREIKRMLLCRFHNKKRKDICLIGKSSIYVFDSLTGEMIYHEDIRKISKNNLVVGDFDSDGLDEIAMSQRNQLSIIGYREYHTITIDLDSYRIKKIKIQGQGETILAYNKTEIKVYNKKTNVFEKTKGAAEGTIIDVYIEKRGAKVYVLTFKPTMRNDGYFYLYKLNSTTNSLEELSRFGKGATFIPNISKLEIVSIVGNTVYLRDREYLYKLAKKQFAERIAVSRSSLAGNFIPGSEINIIALVSEQVYLIRSRANKPTRLIKLEQHSKGLNKGDIDGDGKDELLVSTSDDKIMIFDPFLYLSGCESTFQFATMGAIYNIAVEDIDNDAIDEIIALTSRGIEVYKLDILIDNFDREDWGQHALTKIGKHLLRQKIQRMCGEQSQLGGNLSKTIAITMDGRKALIWSKSKTKDSINTDLS